MPSGDLAAGPALVTGASGFIGSAVVRALAGSGVEVRALVEPGRDDSNLDGLDVDRIEADIRDVNALDRAVDGVSIVFHLAAVYRFWARDPRHLLRRQHRRHPERAPGDGAGGVPTARVHEHGRHDRRRPRRAAGLGAHIGRVRASVRALQAIEVPRRARSAARGCRGTAGRARAPDVPGGRGRFGADADGPHHSRVPERTDTCLRRHRPQRRARRRRRSRPCAGGAVRSTRSQLRAGRREHVAPGSCSPRSPTCAGCGPRECGCRRARCSRSCGPPSGCRRPCCGPNRCCRRSRCGWRRPGWSTTTAGLGRSWGTRAFLRGRRWRVRQDGMWNTASSKALRWSASAAAADLKPRSGGRCTLPPQLGTRNRRCARRERSPGAQSPSGRVTVASRRGGSGPGGAGPLRRACAPRGTRAGSVRPARALRESADAARAPHDRVRRRLRACRRRLPLRPRRPPVPRLLGGLRGVRARAVPSGDRAGPARRDGGLAAESRADGVLAALRPARGSARGAHAQRRLPLLLHEQRRGVGRDRPQVRAVRDRPVPHACSPTTPSTGSPREPWR